MLKKVWNVLISPITMGVLLLMGAFSMGVATFIENDLGATQAKAIVYNARWFEVLIALFAINLIGSIFHRKLYKRNKLTIFIFHLAFIVMILGASITRYHGYEGMMHIREGATSNVIQTQEIGLTFDIYKNEKLFSKAWDSDIVNRKSGFSGKIKVDKDPVKFQLTQYLPNAYEKAVEKEKGKPVIGFVLADKSYRGIGYIEIGSAQKFGNTLISFNSGVENPDIWFTLKNDTFYIESKLPFETTNTSDEVKLNLKGDISPITLKKLYQTSELNIVVHEMYKKAVVSAVAASNTTQNKKSAYIFDITYKNIVKEMVVWSNEEFMEETSTLDFDDLYIVANYGSKNITLPFKLQLDNFEIERYPGSQSPSSFSSYVQIMQPDKAPEKFHIFMNNILKMHGYRFYQSSYDNDEKGTILSVNYDSAGTSMTYFGYFLLLVGILFSIFNKNSFFKHTHLTKAIATLIVTGGITLPLQLSAQPLNETTIKGIDKKHADRFGELLIQDNKGRTEPVYTFSSDLMRKISRKESMYGLTPVQVILDMSLNYENWVNVPLIKVTNTELQKEIGILGNYASYNDFISPTNGYKLQNKVEAAFNIPPGKQSKFDKELIKVDERLNICYAIFNGSFLKLFPIPNSEDHQWHVSSEAQNLVGNSSDSAFLSNILPVYFKELQKSKVSGKYKQADEYLEGIFSYQKKYSGYELPSAFKVKTEVSYYKWNVFNKLFPYYASWGFILLLVLIAGIIAGRKVPVWLEKSLTGTIFIGFLAHTAALIIRWYISGHAPMSNGFESMIFISWVTMLAGFIFSRQSLIALSATSVLSGFTLMVAHLSFMDPEITNLVPVLKSYWLTVHVSVITGSYGFLGLGALLGLIVLILIILQNKSNYSRLEETIETLTKINHKTLILGLYFLTIGTFLGAVWANESWGRYWGWDPKETWSLITILIYSFVIHARLIHGMRGQFAFNTLSIYAFFSVLMTYFGVNYYLSGLHSYASGDPIPIPIFVYVSVLSLVLISRMAWVKQGTNQKLSK